MNVRSVTLLLVLAAALDACTPTAGGKCTASGKASCVDGKRALVCVAGAWVEMACGGPKGCESNGDRSACDDSVAAAGDPCGAQGDFACTKDQKAYLACRGDKWSMAGACRGSRGCVVGGDGVTCDATTARIDDACGKEGSHACDEEGKTALVCSGRRFRVARRCGGPKHCEVRADDVACDDSAADVGDACEGTHYTCSGDARLVLVCRDGRFARDEECGKKKRCKVTANAQVGCAM